MILTEECCNFIHNNRFSLKSMKVLITGSSGYLGSLMTEYLINENISVVGLDIKPGKDYNSDFFRFYDCPIEEKERMFTIFNREKPSHVLHFACSFNKIRDRNKETAIDIGGSKNVLNASIATPSVRQLIFSSSAAAYGGHHDNKEWLSETDPLRPGKYRYGLNKQIIEGIYCRETGKHHLHIASLRIPTVIGPTYSKTKSIVSILMKFPFLPLFCYENRLQFLHSEDMKHLMGMILNDGEIDGIYNLAPDSYAYVRELVPDKKYIYAPLFLVKSVLWVLWHLRLLNLQPAGVGDAAYPVVMSPAKLLSRYKYSFMFSSGEAFGETLLNNSLPSKGLI